MNGIYQLIKTATATAVYITPHDTEQQLQYYLLHAPVSLATASAYHPYSRPNTSCKLHVVTAIWALRTLPTRQSLITNSHSYCCCAGADFGQQSVGTVTHERLDG